MKKSIYVIKVSRKVKVNKSWHIECSYSKKLWREKKPRTGVLENELNTEVCSTERALTSTHQNPLYLQHKFWWALPSAHSVEHTSDHFYRVHYRITYHYRTNLSSLKIFVLGLVELQYSINQQTWFDSQQLLKMVHSWVIFILPEH